MVTRWWPTPALLRACAVAAIGLALALVLGAPGVAVLVAPFAVLAAPALARRPAADPRVRTRLEEVALHEGQGTRVMVAVEPGTPGDRLEHLTRIAVPTAHVATRPPGGRTSTLLGSAGAAGRPGELAMQVAPRRWGPRRLGHERTWVTSAWGGYRFGPVEHLGQVVPVLPQAAALAGDAEAPDPRGLVGAHRSRREAGGVEFSGVRPFQPGDRLRRVNWRVSSRSDQLHVTSARAEDDTAVLLVVDALADLGRSGGTGGSASSLDLAVRAAAAVAEHHVRQGDRVGLRVVGLEGRTVAHGAGGRHLRRLLGTLALVRPGTPTDRVLEGVRLRAGAGTTVLVFSPLLEMAVATAAADLARRGLPVLVVDTLPPDLTGAEVTRADPAAEQPGPTDRAPRVDRDERAHRVAQRQAWRMRVVEREQVLASLEVVGCPVVAWRGPGTLDAVLRGLARRSSLPRGRR